MKIAIASGKGGTGKTLISTNLFNILENGVYIDCDVEEPNGHIFFKNFILQETLSVNKNIPNVNKETCNFCGRCQKVCNFNAIIATKSKILIFPELCHDCGSCIYFCPQNSLTEKKIEIGKIEVSSMEKKKLLTGYLNIGEPMAPPIIKKLKELTENEKNDIILDSPPGTSCPMIETVIQADFTILVTEPTPFGLNDLQLAVGVLKSLEKPFGIVINKYGFAKEKIEKFAREENIDILSKIPHDEEIANLYSQGKLISNNTKYKDIFIDLYKKIKNGA
jgi:MinD superfamily P-loop ATPase